MWWFLCTLAAAAQAAPLLGGKEVLKDYFFMRFHARLCTFWQRLARWWGEVRSEQIQDGFAVSFPGAFIHQVVNDVGHFGIG